MARRIIQLAESEDRQIVALCNDGSVWREGGPEGWMRLAAIPQDGYEEPAVAAVGPARPNAGQDVANKHIEDAEAYARMIAVLRRGCPESGCGLPGPNAAPPNPPEPVSDLPEYLRGRLYQVVLANTPPVLAVTSIAEAIAAVGLLVYSPDGGNAAVLKIAVRWRANDRAGLSVDGFGGGRAAGEHPWHFRYVSD